MKSKLAILLLAVPLFVNAQGFYFGGSFDVKMAKEGPTAESYQHIKSSFNWEARLGWEIYDKGDTKGWRTGTGIENHNAIDYTKWYFHVDKMLIINSVNDKVTKPIKLYAGGELGAIWRTPPPNHWRNHEASFTLGVNFEIQYEFSKHFSIAANYNFFYGEAAIIRDATKFTERIREDFMVGFYFKSN